MPSTLHETLIEMFRHRPSLAAELLSGAFDVRLPDFRDARLDPGEFTDLVATEYRADAVVVLTGSNGPVTAVIVEVQLRRDQRKRWSWPVYVTTLRSRLQCPAMLLVVCTDPATAAWCATPIELGNPASRLVPMVLGPDRVPIVTDVEQAVRYPELAVLSAMAHGGDPERAGVLDALFGALATLDEEHSTLYSDLVMDALPAAARRHLEALVTIGTYKWEYQTEFIRRYVHQGRAEGLAEGLAEGEARALLAVLDARGIDVPDVARTRITGCTDHDQLDTWLRRAATAESVDELFV